MVFALASEFHVCLQCLGDTEKALVGAFSGHGEIFVNLRCQF